MADRVEQPGDWRSNWTGNVWVLMAVAPFLVLVIAHWSDLPAYFTADYAQYLQHAEALIDGRHYGDIGYIYTPFNRMAGPQLQPPGWPVLLAPFVATFGTSLVVAKVLVTISACAFLFAVAFRFQQGDSRLVAILTAALTGLALESSFATNSPISDLPFAALLWALILLVDSGRPLTWSRAALIAIVGIAAISFRIIGVVVGPTIVLLAILRPADRTRLAAVAGVWLALALVAVLLIGVDRVPFLSQVIPATWNGLVFRVTASAAAYPDSVFEAVLYPAPWPLVNDVYHVLVLFLMVPGLVVFVRRYWKSGLGCLTILYVLALVLLSPIRESRYLWPLWPVFAYSVVAGARVWAGWVRLSEQTTRRLAPIIGGGWILVCLLTALAKPSPPALLADNDIKDVMEWVRNESKVAPMRVVFFNPKVLALETGVPSMPWFRATPEETLEEFRRAGITHVIVGRISVMKRETESLEAAIRTNPDAFQLVRKNGTFEFLRVTVGESRPG